MIRRVNAVLGWEASKEINSRGRGDARKNGALARGLLDLTYGVRQARPQRSSYSRNGGGGGQDVE